MRCLLLLVPLATGCAAYTQSKIELTEQVRRGVELTRQATATRQRVIDRLNDLQLERLDTAFDADVRSRPQLEPEWVIDHRKAYAFARDAVVNQRHTLRREQETIETNLNLMDRALQELQLMHQLESKLNVPEVMR